MIIAYRIIGFLNVPAWDGAAATTCPSDKLLFRNDVFLSVIHRVGTSLKNFRREVSGLGELRCDCYRLNQVQKHHLRGEVIHP